MLIITFDIAIVPVFLKYNKRIITFIITLAIYYNKIFKYVKYL